MPPKKESKKLKGTLRCGVQHATINRG